MSTQIDDFFKPLTLTDVPGEEDYKIIDTYINAARKFSQTTYQSLYIVDYYRRGFLYVSDNPLFLCGHKSAEVLEAGYLFYLKNVPPDDLKFLLEINQAGFSFFNNLLPEERLEYSISYDFHLTQPNNHLLLINHKLTPLLLDKSSNIWLALCIVSTSSNDRTGNAVIHKINHDKAFHYDDQDKSWRAQPVTRLTNSEKGVLLLSSQGFTVEEIACKIYLTPSAIKFHRKNILRKLNVKNISEAIVCAINYKLI